MGPIKGFLNRTKPERIVFRTPAFANVAVNRPVEPEIRWLG